MINKTAEDFLLEAYQVIKAKQSSAHEDVDPALVKAMKLYANAKLDQAAEVGKTKSILLHGHLGSHIVEQAILELKDPIIYDDSGRPDTDRDFDPRPIDFNLDR